MPHNGGAEQALDVLFDLSRIHVNPLSIPLYLSELDVII